MKTPTPFAATVAVLGLTTFSPAVARAQDARLVGRLPDAIGEEVNRLVDSARALGLPSEPIVDRALEGAAKQARGDLIVQAVRRLFGELETARDAFGDAASPSELTAGASALRAGATQADLVALRTRRPEHALTMAAAVLADLVAVGVPPDTAIAAVLALAERVDDTEYVAFRRNVERDIALGASPAAALGVRLGAVTGELAADAGSDRATTTPARKRKP